MKIAKISKYLCLFILILFFIASVQKANSKDCYPTPPNPELIINGNFELGFFGFKTTYDTSFIKFPKNIKITTNPYNEYYTFDSCSDPVTPNGKFLIVNGNDFFDGLHIVWEQEVEILPHNYYEFKFMYCNIDARVDTNKNLPIIQYSFNEQFFDTVYVSKETCKWQIHKIIWYSGTNTKLLIRFRDLQLKYFGNDFALDEISLKSLCSVQACAGNNQEMCAGDTIVLGDITNKSAIQGFPPYKYKWYPENGLSSPYSPNPLASPNKTTTYYLEVTDSLGCMSFDSITVTVHFRPLAKIAPNKQLPICPCDSVTLSATEGLTYFWSTGDTTSSITIKEPGYYSLRVVNYFGCVDTTGLWVGVYPISTTLQIDTIHSNIGEAISLPIRLVSQTNHFICNYDSFNVVVTYNPTVLFPINHKPFFTDGNIEKISIIGRSQSDILDSLTFFVTLGNDTLSDIVIENFQWNCNKVNIKTNNGKVAINNICKEGGNRLFDIKNKLFISTIPNPISGEFLLTFNSIEKGLYSIYLITPLGQVEYLIRNSYLDIGTHSFSFDFRSIQSGLYYLVFETPSLKFFEKIVILN
ncbi:MAG: hypothetical protein N2560_07915 [Ignavibacteria bacterium]|nr:hypothetical protein [Ignavibacteria bacterium]